MKKLLFCLSLFTLISCEKYVTEISTITLSGKYLLQKVSIVQIENPTDSMRNFDVGGMVINRFLPDPFDSLKIGGFYMYFNYSTLKMNLLPKRPNEDKDIWEYGMSPYDDIFYHRVPYSFDAYTFGKIYFEYKPKDEKSYRKIILNIDSDLTESLQLSGLDFSPYGKNGPKYRYILHLKRT
jgi:hypothetical protein